MTKYAIVIPKSNVTFAVHTAGVCLPFVIRFRLKPPSCESEGVFICPKSCYNFKKTFISKAAFRRNISGMPLFMIKKRLSQSLDNHFYN